MTRRAPCPICSGTSTRMTDEDVTPVWVRQILRERLKPTSPVPPRTKVRICQTCNAALNRTFEIPCRPVVEPLIRGETVTLDTDAQLKVAAWTTKTMLVRTVGDSRATSNPPTREAARRVLVDLMASGVPSQSTLVRLGYWTMDELGLGMLHLPDPRPFTRPSWLVAGPTIQAAPSLKYLKWETVIALDGDEARIARFANSGADGDRLLRVWPPLDPSRAVGWPPPVRMRTADVDAYQAAWASPEHSYYTEKHWTP